MFNPILVQAQNWDAIASVCLQHLMHLPIFLGIVLVAAFFLLPVLFCSSVYLINRIGMSLATSKARFDFGCHTCGEPVKGEWDFCPKCGAEVYLPAFPPTSTETVMIEERPYRHELPAPMPNFLQLAQSKKILVPEDKD
ncbi:MAG TPA: zinc ribbon domain-containing protein [Thermodesulfobacteriota bacterium]|nr:zinc ribbon domain-containing protein [Thermodesulfobacteriota bacterium]